MNERESQQWADWDQGHKRAEQRTGHYFAPNPMPTATIDPVILDRLVCALERIALALESDRCWCGDKLSGGCECKKEHTDNG